MRMGKVYAYVARGAMIAHPEASSSAASYVAVRREEVLGQREERLQQLARVPYGLFADA